MSRSHKSQVWHRRRRGRAAPLAAIVIVLMSLPARTGPPGTARPAPMLPPVTPAFRAHLLASPFGTIHAATFRFSQPVGTEIPALPAFRLAAYTADSDALSADAEEDARREFPEINRSLKGPRLVPRGRPDGRAPPETRDAGDTTRRSTGTNVRAGDAAEAEPLSAPAEPGGEAAIPAGTGLSQAILGAAASVDDGAPAAVRVAWIYFAAPSPGATPVALEPWPADAVGSHPPDSDAASPPTEAPTGPPRNATIAAKGEVTGADRRPKSPAELLNLAGADRARHEKCLANAIYFEARGEPVRGQMAVAQVVINRVFSGHYPGNVCGVVYQSTRRHRRLRCQFSFTCDGIPDRVTEPDAWDRARRIARDALDGNFWLDDVGKATHYHARWVHPWWVHEMRRLDRIGVHTFYRPRKWGDGAGSPVWGDARAKVEKL